jgi:hypothetical protein
MALALISIVAASGPATALTQQTSSTGPRDGLSSTEVINEPPPPAQPQAAPSGIILERPGSVLLRGTPVRAHFRSPTDGVSFQLQAGGSYSSVSGVSFGVGWGGGGYGWGWGGYGAGFGGIAPYYGEVVTKAYQPICEAPCDATLLSGKHRVALSLDGGKPVNVRQPLDLSEESIVEGRYVDKKRLRKAGWATFAAGAVAGMAMMFASVNYRYDPTFGQQIRYPPMFYTGVGLFVSSIITGAVLAAQDDEAYVNVYPVE